MSGVRRYRPLDRKRGHVRSGIPLFPDIHSPRGTVRYGVLEGFLKG